MNDDYKKQVDGFYAYLDAIFGDGDRKCTYAGVVEHAYAYLKDRASDELPFGTLTQLASLGKAYLDDVHNPNEYALSYLTVGDLRNMLCALPESMPVCYQIIEDKYFNTHGWRKTNVSWSGDSNPTEDLLEFAKAHPDDYRINADGSVTELTGCVPAFGAYVSTDARGKRLLLLHAHY